MTVIHGDALDILKTLDDNSIDSVITDPPYALTSGEYKHDNHKGGFMNKSWDARLPSVDIWKECLRVLKHGAFAAIMSSPRQDVLSRMIVNLQYAGFRTDFTSIYWSYASGFPKASNTSVVLRKRYATHSKSQLFNLWKTVFSQTKRIEENNDGGTLSGLLEDLEQGKQYEIYAYKGSQVKEICISQRQGQSVMEGWDLLQKEEGQLCRCEICKMPVGIYINGKKRWICYGTQIDNGSITWQAIDENGMCSSYQSQPIRQSIGEFDVICDQCITQKIRESHLESSFLGFQPKPAVEIILIVEKPLNCKSYVDQALSNGKGITWLDSVRIPYQNEKDIDIRPNLQLSTTTDQYGYTDHMRGFGNENGRFPANLLCQDDVLNDGTVRVSKYGKQKQWNRESESHVGFLNGMNNVNNFVGDSGSYSRYFDLDKWFDTTFPFLAVPKASSSEKNKGLDQWIEPQKVNDGRVTPIDNPFQRGETLRKNIHPTVKPLKLMSWLVTLLSRPNDVILDPFMGSGTTCIAAKLLKRKYIGIEKELEYLEIARQRIKAY